MYLGAQLFSLRQYTQTAEDFHTTLQKLKEIGYDSIQVSGIGPIPAEQVAKAAEENGLPVLCTHSNPQRILEDLDALIEEHRTFGCAQIGIGYMGIDSYSDLTKARAVLAQYREAAKKLQSLGMSLAYHNHADEFRDIGGTCFLALLLEEFPEIHFIFDTYWATYAGEDPEAWIRRIGGKRMENVHFKDMKEPPKGMICACGDGFLDFQTLHRACAELGVQGILVEQDNAATDFPDAFAQMERSYRHLRPILDASHS